MILYKAISAVLSSAILLSSVFFQNSNAKYDSYVNGPEGSNSDNAKTDYSHLLSDERYKSFFDSEDEVDPAVEAAIESEYKEKQQKEYADAILNNSKIGEYIDIQDFYSTKPQFRLEGDETLSTYVFQNADGTNTTYYLAENVKYVSEDGTIREKDIHLKQGKDGYYVNESDVKLRISQSPIGGVTLETLLGTIETSTYTEDSQKSFSSTNYSREDNSVTYSDLFGTGQHLRITPLLSGIQEDFIFGTKPERNSYTITVSTDKLDALQKDGNIFLNSRVTNSNLSFEQVYIYDAKGFFCPVEVKLEPLDANGSYSYTVFLPDEFIDSPDVVYPLTVSLKMQVRSGLNNNEIVDASVYQNVPNMNAGSWSYNNIGYTDSTYGLARTLIKLEGMLSSSIYQNLNASNITSVYFKAREATGNSYKQVKIHPMTGTPTWTESSVTWNNYGTFDTGYNYGGSIGYDEWSSFDITNLVKAWKNNSYNGNGCFIFIMGGTESSACRALYSSEYSTSSYRPYVQMTYQNPYLSLMYTDKTIEKGETFSELAVINPTTGTLTWSINPTEIASATVNTSTSNICYISGLQPGKATLTAQLYYGTTLMATAYCTVTVILPEGVYLIRHTQNNVSIRTNGTINNNTSLYQWNIGNISMPEYTIVQYYWKIKYLGSDRYSIRSMMKSDMGLTAGNFNSVVLSDIGTSDSLSQLGSSKRWGITWNSSAGGIVIYKDSSTSQVIKGQDNSLQSGIALVTGDITSQSRWFFEIVYNPPEGVSFYKVSDGTYYSDPVLIMVKGQTMNLQQLGIKIAVYRTDTNVQTVMFSMSTQSEDYIDISPIDNTILAKKAGIAVISAESIFDNITQSGTFTVDVAPFGNGAYYIQNVDTDRFMYANNINNGAGLKTENFNNQAQWQLEYIGDSYYTIMLFGTNYYVGVENDSNSNNASVVLRSGNVTNGMKWKYEEDNNGFWTITPKCAESVNMHMKEVSFSNIKISNSTGAASKWMIWSTGNFFAAWTPTYWYSSEDGVGYWNKPQEDALLIHKHINYEGTNHNFSDAFDFAESEWEQALGITISEVSNEDYSEMRYFVDTTANINDAFGNIESYFNDHGDIVGMALISEKTLIGHCCIGQNRIISVYNITKSNILLKTDASLMYYSENRAAAHEMGHALGFFGHIPASYVSDSVMSQGQYGSISGLTSYDINHLLQVYIEIV